MVKLDSEFTIESRELSRFISKEAFEELEGPEGRYNGSYFHLKDDFWTEESYPITFKEIKDLLEFYKEILVLWSW